MLHEPPLLFLDEPTSGVDPVTRREFWSHINALADHGVTVLVTTHFMMRRSIATALPSSIAASCWPSAPRTISRAGCQRGGRPFANRLLADLFFANNGRGLHHPGRAGSRRTHEHQPSTTAGPVSQGVAANRPDPSSILIAFIMPVVLLVVMGYAINLDVDHLRLGIWRTDSGAPAVRLEQALRGSTALEIHSGPSKESLLASLARGEIRGLLVIDDGFSRALAGQGNGTPQALLLTDGSEPNTANFVTNYVRDLGWWLAGEGSPCQCR